MEQYFKDFEERLRIAEEKLDILSEWHLAKKHKGATEITEQCRFAITALWLEFDKLAEAYREQDADHENFLNANVDNLLGELKKHDEFLAKNSLNLGHPRPHWLLFNYLNAAVRSFTDPEELAPDDTGNIWQYLRDLIIKDLKEKELLK